MTITALTHLAQVIMTLTVHWYLLTAIIQDLNLLSVDTLGSTNATAFWGSATPPESGRPGITRDRERHRDL